MQDRQRERRLGEAVDDLADDVGALVAEEQRRQHLDLEVRAQADLAELRVDGRHQVGDVAAEVLELASELEVGDDAVPGLDHRVLGRVVGAIGRQRRRLVVLEVVGRDRRADEDEVVVEVAAVQDLGRHRVEEGLGELGLVVVDEQADVVQLDLLPDLHRQRRRLELVLQPLGRLGDAPLVVGDALRLRLLLAVPVGGLEARLRLGARLAKEPVVAVEAVEHRARDRERARVGQRCGEGRRRGHGRDLPAQHLLRRCLLGEDLVERRAQLGQARLELGAVARQDVEEAPHLRFAVALRLVHVDQLLHLRELEAEPLAAQVSVRRARSRAV